MTEEDSFYEITVIHALDDEILYETTAYSYTHFKELIREVWESYCHPAFIIIVIEIVPLQNPNF